MSIRRKILLTWAATFVIALAAMIVLFYSFLSYPFSLMDREGALDDYERARNAIDDRLAALDVSTGDWAPWDDAYRFVLDSNEDYIQTNLGPGTLANLELNLMIFLDAQGGVVYAEAIDLATGESSALPQGLEAHLQPGSPLLTFPEGAGSHSGILALPEGPLLVTTQPILTSQWEGPSRGTLLLGRFLDDALLARISESVRLPIGLFAVGSQDLPEDVQAEMAALMNGAGVIVRDSEPDSLASYGLLTDVYGAPALVMHVDSPRLAHLASESVLRVGVAGLLVLGTVIGALALFITEKLVLSRVTRLTSRVLEIAAGGDSAERVDVEGDDELPKLAEAINRMLAALGESQSALRASEERFRAFFTGAGIGIYVKDLTLRYTLVNPAMAEILGRDPVDVVFRVDEEILRDPKEVERLRGIDLRGIGGEVVHDERKMAIGGRVRVFQRISGPVRDQKGSVIGVYGVLRDISEMREAEGELRRLRELHERVVEAAFEGIAAQDVDGRFILLNPAAERMLGYAPGELIGETWTRIIPPDQRPIVLEADSRRRQGQSDRYEVEVIRKDNVRVPVVVSGSPILDGARVAGTLAVFIDISEINRAQRELEQAHRQYLTALDGVEADIYAADMATYEILFMNRHMRESFGQDLVGKTCWKAFRHAEAPCAHCTNEALLAAGPKSGEVIVWEGQNPITGRVYINYDRAIDWVDGRLARLQVATDITERKRAEEALAESERKYRTLFQQVADPVVITSPESGKIIDCNESMVRIYGYTRQELAEMTPSELLAEEDRPAAPEMQRVGGSIAGLHQTKQGQRTHVEIVTDEIVYLGQPAWMSVIRDVSAHKREEMRLSRLANFDALTGLANPLLFDDRIRRALARSERSGDSLALLYIDLDHFKEVNDQLGHAAGNEVLRQVAARLEGSVRKVDTVARLGGDEFTVILEGIRNPKDAAGVARKVLDRMRPPFQVDGRDVAVTTSIGLALFPQDAVDAEGLLRCADIALYHAKGKGRDAVAEFSPGLGDRRTRPSAPFG